MTPTQEIVNELVETTGASRETAEGWLNYMITRTRKLLAEGVEYRIAIVTAHNEMQQFLSELAVGTTPRARVYRAYITHRVYAEANGLEFAHVGNAIEEPHEWALVQTIDDNSLADLRLDGDIIRGYIGLA